MKLLHFCFILAILLPHYDSAASHLHTIPITDAVGRTVAIPIQANKIVALSELDLDAALALGVKPVGATLGRGQASMPRYLAHATDGILVVGQFGNPILDKILSAQPDLILAGGISDPNLLAQLSRIAPTVVSFKLGDDWQIALRQIGILLGRQSIADNWLRQYQHHSNAARAHLNRWAGAQISIVRWHPQGPSYMLADAFARKVLADLQLTQPPAQRQSGIAHSPPLSLETLERIDGDWLFIGTLTANGPASDALKTARHNPAFQNLMAVKHNHVVSVDGSLWTSLGGPLAALALITETKKILDSQTR